MHVSQDPPESLPEPAADTALCNCLAFRQAARHVSQFYDQALAPFGLRTTQYSILNRLQRSGPWAVQALAAKMVMDRTTLGRTIRPLERDGLVTTDIDPTDRRVRALRITPAGESRLQQAKAGWASAQSRFEAAMGAEEAARLRARLKVVSRTKF